MVFASSHGHTGKIASRIADGLGSAGLSVDLRELGEGSAPEAADYELVVAGGSLHLARHQPELVKWAKANRSALEQQPSCFFSVSLTAADDTDEAREATQECVEEFIEATGWRPDRIATIAGALQYREYDVFTRTLVRLKMKAGGHPADTSTDHEFTDWDAVDAFAADCSRLAASRTGGG